MKKLSAIRAVLCLLLAAIALAITGCATPDEIENTSARPWAAPSGYDSSLPSSLFEGR
jgi:hypothetical protein